MKEVGFSEIKKMPMKAFPGASSEDQKVVDSYFADEE